MCESLYGNDSLKPLKIYVASPLKAETEEERLKNVNTAIDAGISIFLKGHYPYIPHLIHFIEERAKENGVNISKGNWMIWDIEWLKMCDALLYLNSLPGADIELETAKNLGIKIFYSIDEIPIVNNWRKKHDIRRWV